MCVYLLVPGQYYEQARNIVLGVITYKEHREQNENLKLLQAKKFCKGTEKKVVLQQEKNQLTVECYTTTQDQKIRSLVYLDTQ